MYFDNSIYSGHANGNALEIEDGKKSATDASFKKDMKNFKIGSAINRLLESAFIR